MSVDLKDLKQEFGTLNFRLRSKGSWKVWKKFIGQTQGEIREIKQKVDINEESGRSLEKMVKSSKM